MTTEQQEPQGQQQHVKNSNTTGHFDPLQLETIELTAYVLGVIRKGATTEQLVQSLDRNYSLASVYLRMFDRMGWVQNKDGKWMLTELGEMNMPRFQQH